MRKHQSHGQLEALRFAIEFAQTDLTTADAHVLARSLALFLQLAEGTKKTPDEYSLAHVVALGTQSTDPNWRDVTLRPIQEEALRILTGVVHLNGWAVPLSIGFALEVPGRRQERMKVAGHGITFRDEVLYRLVRLLEDLGVENLNSCPECHRIFFKFGRKRFCSDRCRTRVGMREWRERNPSLRAMRKQGRQERKAGAKRTGKR